MEEERVIDRLAGETSSAYAAFLDYLYMTPARSVRGLHERYVARAKEGAKPPTTRLATLWTWSRTYQWTARVEAYEAIERAKRMEQEQKAREAMTKRHMQIAQALQAKVLQWLKDQENNLSRPADVLAAFKVAVEVERRAMGVPDTFLQITNLSDDELVTRYQHVLTRLTGGGVAGLLPAPADLTEEEDFL
jgi:hypothetical protein